MADEKNLENNIKKIIEISANKKNKTAKGTKKDSEYFENLQSEALNKGKALERDGKYSNAIKAYTDAIELVRQAGKTVRPDVIFRRGYSYGEIDSSEKALEDYLEYIKFKPNDNVAYNNAALAYCKKGMHEKEFEFLKKSVLLNPKYALAYRNMAICYRDRSMYKEALECANKAVELEPNDSENHSIKAGIYEKMGEKEKAIDGFEAALDLNKNNKYASESLSGLKKGDKALSEFNFQVPQRNFVDVAGQDDLKRWAKANVLAPLQNKELAAKYNKRFGGGLMMYGPPGCGKTYFVSALAGEAKIKFIKVKISNIVDLWLGNTEKNIEKLFRSARKNKPCIVFIDEIDGLGSKRFGGPSTSYSDQAVNQFLMELTELEESNEEILVVGATNAPWNVDEGLKRSGRIGKMIYIPEPGEEARVELFKMYLAKVPIDKTVNVEKLAKKATHLAASDVRAICETASGIAFEKACESKNLVPVTQKMLEEAIANERSDVLEWYDHATKMISDIEMREFYPQLFDDLEKLKGGQKTEKKMYG
ncbi:MAG: AAA family ATPase [Candidatus Micrarchaeota archaeon]